MFRSVRECTETTLLSQRLKFHRYEVTSADSPVVTQSERRAECLDINSVAAEQSCARYRR